MNDHVSSRSSLSNKLWGNWDVELDHDYFRLSVSIQISNMMWHQGQHRSNDLCDWWRQSAISVTYFTAWSSSQARYVSPAKTGHSPEAVSMLAHRLRRWPNFETALGECPVFAGGKILDHRRRRWASVNPTSGQRLIFAWHIIQPTKHNTVKQCWFNVGPASVTLTRN